jgi:RNA polymerase sigma factor (TIGR02999 family)
MCPKLNVPADRRVIQDDITSLLVECRDGARRGEAFDRLVALVYDDLKRLARGQLRRWRPGATLDTTALAHEAYLKLAGRADLALADRQHLFRSLAQVMRRLVVDHARERRAQKRGGGFDFEPLPEEEALPPDAAMSWNPERVLGVDAALRALAAADPRAVEVVECRWFAGLTEDETATALGLSRRTVQREWLKARAWLRGRLEGPRAEAGLPGS